MDLLICAIIDIIKAGFRLLAKSVDEKNERIYQEYHVKTIPQNVDNSIISSFPEYNPEEYQRQKKDRETKTLNGCQFWDGINIDFQENLELLNKMLCPYCGKTLPERKGKTYKCPYCKQKIYRLKDLISDFEGLFTQSQKEIREQLKKEISKRKNFLKIYNEAFEYLGLDIPLWQESKEDNILTVVNTLYLGKKSFYKFKKVMGYAKLRMCRFYTARLMEILGQNKESLDLYLQVLYIDIIDESELYKLNITELIREIRFASFILEKIELLTKNKNELKEMFLNNALIVATEINCHTVITPELAWQIIIEKLPDIG